jgi:hypothetical protein
LATVRTATVDGESAELSAEIAVEECKAASIHTSTAAPRSTDTDPVRHSRTSTAASIRIGSAREAVGTGTGGATLLRRPPAEATDIITKRSASLRTATVG